MKSERKQYAVAIGYAKSRLIEYVQSGKDPSFAFRAYLWWRVAAALKDAATDAARAEQVQLATSVGNEPNAREIQGMVQKMNLQFAQLQEVILRSIDEIAEHRMEPTKHGTARANRFRAAYLVAEEALRRKDTGSSEQGVRTVVADRMDLTATNVRKLVDGFHNDAGTQLASDRAFAVLRDRLKANRLSVAPNKRRSVSEHPWRK